MIMLSLQGFSYSRQQLLDGACQTPSSATACHVVDFCRQWLTGQETFALQTSGSTGHPKTLHVTRTQMATSARWTGQALGLQPGDPALVCLATQYIAGMMMLVRGLELGLPLTVIDPVSHPLATGPQHGETWAFTAMVPLQLQATLQGTAAERARLNAMQAVLIGGAPISMALEEALQVVQAPLYHTYGMTETVSHIALRRLNGPQRSAHFVPFQGVHLGLDPRGCLTITSVLTGGETLVTNDLVDLQPDGTFQWLGRLDNVINSGGVKIHTEQVERALEAWLLTYEAGRYSSRRFFVGALPDERLGQIVVALIEGPPWATREVVTTALHTALQPTVARYALPRRIYFVPQFCTTLTGKIDRSATLRTLVDSRQGL